MKTLRAICLTAALTPSLAAAQVYLPPGVGLPPRSVIGNSLPVAGDAVAVSYAQLTAGLNIPVLKTCSSHNWFNSLTSGGVLGCSQPAVSDIAGFGTGVATFLGTPTSANLRAALTDETGTGGAVFATGPTLVNANLGTPSALVLTNATGLPISTGVNGLGTGVATALGVNVGTGGSVVVNGGALGTPSSGALANATGLPISTGVSGLGTGVATFLGTPSSANLRAALTDESGTGAALFQGGDLGTPSAGVATNITALNATQLTTGSVPAARMPALTGDCTTTVGTVATTCTGINGVNLNAAWTTYTPTVTCQTGTITTLGTVSGRSKTIGKTVIAEMDVTITTVGSCTGYLSFTLPVTAASNKYAGSSYDGNTGFSGAAVILPAISTGAALSRRADSTTFAASGANVVTTITYEIP